MARVLPIRKIFLTRMEHREPELFNRIKNKDNSAYQEAVNYVERNIGRIMECSIIDSSFYDTTHYDYGNASWVKVDDRYIYIGFQKGNITILNRWTKQCIKNIDRPNIYHKEIGIICIELSERHLATKFHNGTIVIYDLATFEQTQILHNNSDPYFILGGLGFCITSDILVNLRSSRDETRIVTVTAFDMESLKQVKQRTFTEPYNILIKEECHDGIIVSFEGNCLVRWNVEKNIVQPITEHSSKQGYEYSYSYSARMDHHPEWKNEV